MFTSFISSSRAEWMTHHHMGELFELLIHSVDLVVRSYRLLSSFSVDCVGYMSSGRSTYENRPADRTRSGADDESDPTSSFAKVNLWLWRWRDQKVRCYVSLAHLLALWMTSLLTPAPFNPPCRPLALLRFLKERQPTPLSYYGCFFRPSFLNIVQNGCLFSPCLLVLGCHIVAVRSPTCLLSQTKDVSPTPLQQWLCCL